MSDPRRLVGFSDNVFIGTVDKPVGTKSLDGFPVTQFKVVVNYNIKGNIDGSVIVNQQGEHKWNKITLYEGDELLKEGKTYFFATIYNKNQVHFNTCLWGY